MCIRDRCTSDDLLHAALESKLGREGLEQAAEMRAVVLLAQPVVQRFCRRVWRGALLHEVCLFGYMSQHEDEFPCPNCRTKYTHDSVEQYDEWNADDVIDALLEPDEDFIDNSVSPNASAGKRRCARFAA